MLADDFSPPGAVPFSSSSSLGPVVTGEEVSSLQKKCNMDPSSSTTANFLRPPHAPSFTNHLSQVPSAVPFREAESAVSFTRDPNHLRKDSSSRKPPRVVLVSDQLRQLLLTNDALLYEDDTLQVRLRSCREGEGGNETWGVGDEDERRAGRCPKKRPKKLVGGGRANDVQGQSLSSAQSPLRAVV